MHVAYNIRGGIPTSCWSVGGIAVVYGKMEGSWKDQGRSNGHVNLTENCQWIGVQEIIQIPGHTIWTTWKDKR